MATYPSFPQLVGSSFDKIDDREIKRAVSGKARIHGFFTADKREGLILHDLSDADLATLESFYTTNRDIAFDFVWAGDSVTYSCYFTKVISSLPKSGGFHDVKVSITEI